MLNLRRLLCPLLLLATALCAVGSPTPPAVEFIRVWPRWRPTTDFKSISEYFTHRENDGRLEVRRSQPINRTGYYFLARVKHPHVSLVGARFVLHIIVPTSPDARSFTFPADVGPGEHVFELGLTGSDWAGEHAHPVAWRLDLLDAGGHELAWQQSFLWEKG